MKMSRQEGMCLAFLEELALTEFPRCGVVGFARQNGHEQREAAGWRSLLENTIERIRAITGAREARLCLQILRHEFRVPGGPECRNLGARAPTEEISERTRLAVPIRVSRRWAGYIDLRDPRRGETLTRYKNFLRTTSALLGLAADRAALLHLRQSFTSRVSEDQRLQCMLYRVWALAAVGLKTRRKVESLVLTIRQGVPFGAGIIAWWDDNRRKLLQSESATSSKVLTPLQRIVDQHAEEVLASGAVWARRFASCGDVGPRQDPCQQATTRLAAAVLVPTRRLHSGQGLLALARDGRHAEFTTEEKHALCVVSGLVTELYRE